LQNNKNYAQNYSVQNHSICAQKVSVQNQQICAKKLDAQKQNSHSAPKTDQQKKGRQKGRRSKQNSVN
jgi:hypothetical protein